MINEKIKEILGEVKENPALVANLTDDADIVNDVGLDSLQMVTFILKLEEELALEIDFDSFDFAHMSSLSRLGDFLGAQQPLAV